MSLFGSPGSGETPGEEICVALFGRHLRMVSLSMLARIPPTHLVIVRGRDFAPGRKTKNNMVLVHLDVVVMLGDSDYGPP